MEGRAALLAVLPIPAFWLGEGARPEGPAWLVQPVVFWVRVLLDMVKEKNHEKAPKSAAFVKSMREVFGEVTVLCVRENDVQLGEQEESIEEYIERHATSDHLPN
jgi:hypothetical protein